MLKNKYSGVFILFCKKKHYKCRKAELNIRVASINNDCIFQYKKQIKQLWYKCQFNNIYSKSFKHQDFTLSPNQSFVLGKIHPTHADPVQ